MKLLEKKRKDVTFLDSSMTISNFHISKSKILKGSSDIGNYFADIFKNKTSTELAGTSIEKPSVTSSVIFSDSKYTAVDKGKIEISDTADKNHDDYLDELHTVRYNLMNVENEISQYLGETSSSSDSTGRVESKDSFLTTVDVHNQENNILSLKYNFSIHNKIVRLFNKNGKPLTDRMGRPLLDILGQPLVKIDDEGRIVSDCKGNQVFNSRGESSIYSTTNLYLPPSNQEPGIPLLDIDRKHILFLYDNVGHPMTDYLGRPLLNASGNLMVGTSSKKVLNLTNYKANKLKPIYSKAPLENFVRRVQIFDACSNPLTDEKGNPLKNSTIICNMNGMPMCDGEGNPIFFKYGSRVNVEGSGQKSNLVENFRHINSCYAENSKGPFMGTTFKSDSVSSKNYETTERMGGIKVADISNLHSSAAENVQPNCVELQTSRLTSPHIILGNNNLFLNNTTTDTNGVGMKNVPGDIKFNQTTETKSKTSCVGPDLFSGLNSQKTSVTTQKSKNRVSNKIDFRHELVKHGENPTGEAIILYDGSKKIVSHKSSSNALVLKDTGFRSKRICHSIINRKPCKRSFRSDFLQYFKNAINISNFKCINDRPAFNDYGKPMRDVYGNLLYDKYGIPLTGADGIKLSEKARHILRLKLRNIPISKETISEKEASMKAVIYEKSFEQYGDPCYDKHGRPLYDLFGKLIYDIYGRPLTDAFNRPLIDAIGQPLMDSKGNVLTSYSNDPKNNIMVDVFGRCLYDKRGRALFDLYGRPRFDIFTNAIYDICGRPASDGNGKSFYDFLNKVIQPYPQKPLYKNARVLLPKYIDRILATPSLNFVLKYSSTSLKDIFGGPLFDDFGRPLYNKIGKPLYDKYGRPLYDKDGIPLCDRYGRPLSEEIRQSPNDTTVSVVDSLKLLKLTKESSMWMEIKRSQTKALKQNDSGVLDDAMIMKINPTRHKSSQYTYALTRVTTFSCGRQALEILEAPLSPGTAKEMHHLPMDNKPLVMVARRRKRVIRRHRPAKRK